MIGYIVEGDSLSPHVYADADFTGGPATQRSTTGVHVSIEGEFSHFPIHGVSKRQDCVSSSTPEAELVSGHYAYHKVLLPAMDLWDLLLPSSKRGIFHEDNTAMTQVIKAGKNPTMKHLNRVHRVCVWLHCTKGWAVMIRKIPSSSCTPLLLKCELICTPNI